MQHITPCLWFDDSAEQAAAFYVSVFGGGQIKEIARYSTETPGNKPLGSVMTVLFEIDGLEFLALNGGTIFTPNPSISFFVNRRSAEEIEAIWERQRKTVVLVTNDVDEALLLADRIIALQPGPRATLGREFKVDMPRPRYEYDIRAHADYAGLRHEIWALLEDQIKQSQLA